jgi:hypothetical protein
VFSHFAMRQQTNDVAQRQNMFQHVVSDPDTFLFADAVANIFTQQRRSRIVATRFDIGLQHKMPNSKLIRDKICRAHSTRYVS